MPAESAINEEALFATARALAGPGERAAYLDAACGGDARLRRRLDRLLAACDRADGILDRGPTAAPPARPFAGRFVLRHKLGDGGMGEVWAADQTDPVRRPVAVKMIRPGQDSARLLARFEAERQALARMDHPHVARVFDAGVAGGQPYFVMELIDGVPITTYCDAARLNPRQRLELLIPVCQAVQHAHQKGVIHRDLKPSNILVAVYDGKPVPKVIDFGIAKATGPRLSAEAVETEVGSLVGTLEYMSPEQADLNNPDVDTRTDVYALGVLLYELLTGTVPFPRRQLQAAPFGEMLRIIQEDEPPRPSTRLSDAETLVDVAAVRQTAPGRLSAVVRGDLDWIVMKCLEKDRARRYETATGLADDLIRYLADEPVRAGPPTARYRVRKFVRRHRGPALAAALVTLALVGGLVGTTAGLVRSRHARDAERLAREESDKRLGQIEKGIDVLLGVFRDVDARGEQKGDESLRTRLVTRLSAAADDLEGESVGDPLLVAKLQNRLGITLARLGATGKAVAVLEKAHATYAATLGPDDPATLTAAANLANAYRDDGQLPRALTWYDDTLKRRRAVRGDDDPATVVSISDLAAALWAAGQPDRALPLQEEAVGRMQIRDPHARDTLTAMSNLSLTYQDLKRLDDALTWQLKALDLRRKHLGEDHPDTLQSLGNLATVYWNRKEAAKGLPPAEERRRLTDQKLGSRDPETLSAVSGLAPFYLETGQVAKGLELYRLALDGREKVLPDGHPDTITTQFFYGTALTRHGPPDEALKQFRKAAAGVEKVRYQHRLAVHIVPELCRALEAARSHDEAEGWRRKWVAVAKRFDRPDQPAHAQAVLELGNNLMNRHQVAAAAPLYRQAYDDLTAADPDARKHPARVAALARVLDRLAHCADALAKPDEAARWRQELQATKSGRPQN